MIEMALEYLKVQINYMPVGKFLLADKFTMSDVQILYETILQKKVGSRKFPKKNVEAGNL